MSAVAALPHWDVSTVYPSLESPEFAAGFERFTQAVNALAALFDAEDVGAREPAPLDERTVQGFETVATRFNETLDQAETLNAYIYSFVSTNSRDALAQARQSELQQRFVTLSQLGTRFTAWLGSLDIEALIARSALAGEHAYALRRAQTQAQHLMSPAEEALAAELNVTGGGAWSDLHGNVASQLSVPFARDGNPEHVAPTPMSVIRAYAFEPDRELRRRAYEAELAGWRSVEIPLAAAMNSIKGQVNTLTRRRGWDSALDATLFDASIDRETLDAMMGAARDAFPDFRRYLKAKARALGLPALAWYDLFAPMPAQEGESRAWSFDQAEGFIVEQFGRYSPSLGDFAARAFRERWIDAEPRDGKRDGAFCMWLQHGDSRVLANYKSSYDSVSTLAHELGHGYHNLQLANRTPLQRETPMTLAETASIFCETLSRHAAMRDATPAEQLEILEASLQNATQVVVDITSRFLFESRVFERRQERELSVEEFNEIMLEAQRETYGDGLDPNQLHAYMWAMKPHYYSSGLSFYNFPYMFGLLFGLGLYARYEQDASAFRRGYDELLASTGTADAATLAARFGINIRDRAFWEASLALVGQDVDEFERLVGA